MATIDIGKLTFTHKGDYSGSTAYVLNDVVYYNGSAYIAKTSTTGNLPTSTAHWNQFSAGSGGIWNSGLSIGTAGQVVKVNSGASALEFGDAGGGLESVQTFTTSGTHTYTKPSGINKIRVFITGGGGAGGGNTNSGYGYQIGQGGAAGGTAIKFLDASSITTVTVTIGAGGTGVTGSSGGNTGGTSSFGSHCSATGGEGGDAPGAFGGTQSGGVGSSGDLNLKGSAGGCAIESGGGAQIGSPGGSSYWGGAGAGQWSANGEAGEYGSGGGSAGSQQTDRPGANGGAGVCYVEEYK